MEKPTKKEPAPAGEVREPTLELGLARNRCPFCHEDLEPAASDSVSCGDCLARHHTACWDESPRCSSCGSERAFVAASSGDQGPRRRGSPLFGVVILALGFVVVGLGLGLTRAEPVATLERTAAVTAPPVAEPPRPRVFVLAEGEAQSLEEAERYFEAGLHQRDNVGAERDRGVKLLSKALALLPGGSEHEGRERDYREQLAEAYRKRAEQAGFRGLPKAQLADLNAALEVLPLDSPQREEIDRELEALGESFDR